ncbi:hypothetical protein [Nonomuraea sp. NPDC050783]|uniref:hypothetical protein n=1 Tax=Nonomuraea sp. NPDC050783 TaxID=3154634 RepID=UPI0034676D38
MIDYYRDLLRRHAWLQNGLCWLVVQPLGEEPAPDDLLWRLNGGRDPEQRVVEHPVEASIDEHGLLFVFEGDGARGYLNLSGLRPSDHVLAGLSEGSRVWMTTWHFKGGHTVLYAAGGRVRASLGNFVFAGHLTEEGDPAALADLRATLGTLAPDDHTGKCAAALAFVEAATGVAVEGACFEEEAVPVVILDRFPPEDEPAAGGRRR